MQRRSKRGREATFYAEWAIGTRSEQNAQHERAKWERTIDESKRDADRSDSTSDDEEEIEAPKESVTTRQSRVKQATIEAVTVAAAAAASSTPQTREQREQCHLAFIEANQNINTRATYASGWRQFVEWTQKIENRQRIAEDAVDLERPTESDIAAYARYLVTDKGSTMSTVHGAIAAIAHKLQYVISEEYHPTHGVVLKNTLQVLKLMAEPAQQKKEVQWAQLVRIAAEADRDSSATKISRRDACMFMLAYFTLLRSSEVVRMTRGEISFFLDEADGRMIMQVHINKQCKNDTERLGHNRLVKEKEEGKECIVRRMQKYLAATAPHSTVAAVDSVLFPKEDGGKMSRATPNHRFQHWLRMIGVENATAYGFHSLRAGGATDAARAGVSEREIKIHGNWRSNAVQLYMRPGQEERLAASSALGQ